jgi:hypothetical protein
MKSNIAQNHSSNVNWFFCFGNITTIALHSKVIYIAFGALWLGGESVLCSCSLRVHVCKL